MMMMISAKNKYYCWDLNTTTQEYSESRIKKKMYHASLLVLTLFSFCSSSSDFVQLGLKWGDKCKIAGHNEFLKASEECEMSKGLHCQPYQQGNLCGCMIKSSLSWDEHAGECRRKVPAGVTLSFYRLMNMIIKAFVLLISSDKTSFIF